MTATKYHAVADTFVSVARHGSRWGCYMQDEETKEYAWIGEWQPTKAAAVAYAQQQYPLPAKLVADALFARQAARDARKVQEAYYTAPGFDHARYAELVDAKKGADSEWNRAMDRVDANSEAADLYQEAVNVDTLPELLATPDASQDRGPDAADPSGPQHAGTLSGLCPFCRCGPVYHVALDVVACLTCGRQWAPDDPQTPAAREAAQRADEAELRTVQCIHLERAEGLIWECGMEHVVFSLEDAESKLYEWAWTAPEPDQGYHKADVRIEYTDGTTHYVRADLQRGRYGYLAYETPTRHRHLCPQCGAAWVHELDRCPHGIYHGCDTCRPYDPVDDEVQRADEGELQAGLLATLPPMAGGSEAAITICRCSRMVDGSCMNLWPGHPAYGTCRCACHAAPMAGGAPTPADDPAGPGATLAEPEPAETCARCGGLMPVVGMCPRCSREPANAPMPHTHPCPTCHQARPCTGTGCADGPRECATCSNCRGW